MANTKPDWHELAGNVAAVIKFIRPLRSIEEIPAAIEAAQAKIAEIEDEIKQKQSVSASMDKDIAAKKREMVELDGKYAALDAEKRAEMEKNQALTLDFFQKEITAIQNKKTIAENELKAFLDATDTKKYKAESDLVELNKQIESKILELTGYQTALTNLLKGVPK